LRGTVGTPEQKATAHRVVSQVPGVRGVRNELMVSERNAPAADVARTPPANPARMQAARAPQPRPAAARPPVAAPRRPAIQQVQYENAEGPAAGAEQAVYNPAASGEEAAMNQRMAENIARSLQSAKFAGYDIEIHYQGGVAVLDGAVAGMNQKVQATSIVSQVPGVQQVENRLNVIAAPQGGPRGPVQGVHYQPPMEQGPGGPMGPPGAPAMGPPQGPPGMGAYCPPGGGMGSNPVYDQPNLPGYAWPSYASYPNYAQVSYPQQYSASAWPYIGPFYPYPQVPLGWRKVQMEWDDGYWNLNFRPRTEKWWWFLNYENW
jgi:hypothetical protein